jgi:hypothetical protein
MCFHYIHEFSLDLSLSILVIIVLLYLFNIHTSSICSPDVFFFPQFCDVAQVVIINKYI